MPDFTTPVLNVVDYCGLSNADLEQHVFPHVPSVFRDQVYGIIQETIRHNMGRTRKLDVLVKLPNGDHGKISCKF